MLDCIVLLLTQEFLDLLLDARQLLQMCEFVVE